MNLSTPVREVASFSSSLYRYSQVLRALLWREVVKRRQSPGEAFFATMEPVVLIVGIGFVYWLLERNLSPVGGSPVLFFATGLFIKFYFIHTSQRMRRTTKVQRLPVELWIDHVFVFVILRFIDYLILGAVAVALLAIFVDSAAIPSNVSRVFEAMLYMSMLAFGWGIIGLIMSQIFGAVAWHIFGLINRVLLWVTGAMFVVDFLPPATRYWISFIPTAHAVILFRQGFYPNYPSLVLDMDYLIGCSIASVVIGVVLERATRRLI